jgi:hypothetical protein
MTREHLWPDALHRQLLAASEQGEKVFWLSRFDQEISSDPTLRDVCAGCNNGPLSILDRYVCQLFENQLSRALERFEKINLRFDYHLLKRWLNQLQLCENK